MKIFENSVCSFNFRNSIFSIDYVFKKSDHDAMILRWFLIRLNASLNHYFWICLFFLHLDIWWMGILLWIEQSVRKGGTKFENTHTRREVNFKLHSTRCSKTLRNTNKFGSNLNLTCKNISVSLFELLYRQILMIYLKML